MGKQSGGILVYRFKSDALEVLLVHPGGPFWANKDKGSWSIPKGEFDENEESITAAKREFEEETGQPVPDGDLIELGSTKNKSGKTIYVWAVKGDLEVENLKSNTFSMEWPPKSGNTQEFPEVDRGGWFAPGKAAIKLNEAQIVFVERLAEHLGLTIEKPVQPSLF